MSALEDQGIGRALAWARTFRAALALLRMRDATQLPPLRIVLTAIGIVRGHWHADNDPVVTWTDARVKPILALSALASQCAQASPGEVEALAVDQRRALAEAQAYCAANRSLLPRRPILEVLIPRQAMPDALRARIDRFLLNARPLLL